MKNYILAKNNNSKKLIIGISILFCTVILIVGGTLAFFSQSDIKSTGNIVTTDINATLKYYDNNDYMRGNLIPSVEEDVIKFASKNELNKYTNGDICKYQDDMYACSLYQFTIENIADVSQKIIITLNPSPNTFSNLYYLIYEGEQLNLTPNSISLKEPAHIDGLNSSQMLSEVIINPGQSKTYTVVFYIKSTDYDQRETDMGKNFGAIINVNSVTTGYNMVNIMGDTCYELTELSDKTYRLTKFNGINHETGEIIEGCGVTKDSETGLYNVEVPSKIGDYNISTLGNTLFSAVNTLEDGTITGVNEFINIEKVTISEGITTIEDGFANVSDMKGKGTFLGIGGDLVTQNPNPNRTLKLKLPSTLKYIGDCAFSIAALREIEIPSNVETIGYGVFYNDSLLTNLIFKTDNDGNSRLKTIGVGAFYENNISTLTIPKSVETIGDSAFSSNNLSTLTIPKSVETIGGAAFGWNENLTTLTFEENSNLKTIGFDAFYGNNISNLIIPSSVQTIGESAFGSNENLKKVIFEDTESNPSKLESIGESAFYHDGLLYETEDDPLYIPASVKSIGNYAFEGNPGWTGKIYFIRYKGSQSNLDGLGTKWYTSRYSVDIKAIGD